MPRFNVVDEKGNWNVFSTAIDDYFYDEFLPFEEFKKELLKLTTEQRIKEINSLLTDYPLINKVTKEELNGEQ